MRSVAVMVRSPVMASRTWSRVWLPVAPPPQATRASRSSVDDFSSRRDQRRRANRDAVVRSFTDLYAANKADFPSEAREPGYRDRSPRRTRPPRIVRASLRRLEHPRSFPAHAWCLALACSHHRRPLERRQQRRYYASSMLIDDNDVKNELVRFLDNQWEPISQDVDGGQSVPTRSMENPNFGRVSACKRVARSLYMGTAPGASRERKGINDQRVKLACVMPGNRSLFGDALRRLGDRGATSSRTAIAIGSTPAPTSTAQPRTTGRAIYARRTSYWRAEPTAKEASKRGSFDVHAQLKQAAFLMKPQPVWFCSRPVLPQTQSRQQPRSGRQRCLQQGEWPRRARTRYSSPLMSRTSTTPFRHYYRRAWQRVIGRSCFADHREPREPGCGKNQGSRGCHCSTDSRDVVSPLVPYKASPDRGS